MQDSSNDVTLPVIELSSLREEINKGKNKSCTRNIDLYATATTDRGEIG